MPRGYRRYIFAAFGCLILAASPPQTKRRQDQGQTSEAIAKSLENVAAALERNNEAAGYNPDCEPGSDNRRSDLCAQWKAADAAAESASWAGWFFWVSIAGTVIGAFTLGAAGAAAYFAKQAADHTAAGATETKRQAEAAEKGILQSQAELRAAFGSIREEVHRAGEAGVNLYVDLQNTGQTPAHGVLISQERRLWTGRRTIEFPCEPSIHIGSIARDGIINLRVEIRLTKRQAQTLANRGCLIVDFSVSFFDVFGESWIFEQSLMIDRDNLSHGTASTAYCYHIRYQGEGPDEVGKPSHELPLEGGGPKLPERVAD
jgi:hypothetical protein